MILALVFNPELETDAAAAVFFDGVCTELLTGVERETAEKDELRIIGYSLTYDDLLSLADDHKG